MYFNAWEYEKEEEVYIGLAKAVERDQQKSEGGPR